ncbi:hypothetical protein GGS23DRAFT_570956 [Durotheca rogersii]|uniref:uncharacterized protein n=1 Tax=Durotheca rogersii TaxID=419775 RepID=UPI0022200045|nr:uncharacterized protein GGS23DRAFT_570956 [Durotheca rogersii]KAI5862593.1 hypothetical protein GGS23DRAFT_570956 [Durotheca rogersii]
MGIKVPKSSIPPKCTCVNNENTILERRHERLQAMDIDELVPSHITASAATTTVDTTTDTEADTTTTTITTTTTAGALKVVTTTTITTVTTISQATAKTDTTAATDTAAEPTTETVDRPTGEPAEGEAGSKTSISKAPGRQDSPPAAARPRGKKRRRSQ